MTTEITSTDPVNSDIKLQVLQQAVDEELEKKRRLGHYYVVWQDGKAMAIGEDAPEAE